MRPQYPGGAAQRAADIEAGRDRSHAEVADDLRGACTRLEAAWADLSDAAWTSGRGGLGQPPAERRTL